MHKLKLLAGTVTLSTFPSFVDTVHKYLVSPAGKDQQCLQRFRKALHWNFKSVQYYSCLFHLTILFPKETSNLPSSCLCHNFFLEFNVALVVREIGF